VTTRTAQNPQRRFSREALKQRKHRPRPRKAKASWTSSLPKPGRPVPKVSPFKEFVVREATWRRLSRYRRGMPIRESAAPALLAWFEKYFGHLGRVDKRTIQRWISRNRT
jgi:hypothetical protein